MKTEIKVNRFLKHLCNIGLTSSKNLPIYKFEEDLPKIYEWLKDQNLSISYRVSISIDISKIIGKIK
jgi:hypothetical protein